MTALNVKLVNEIKGHSALSSGWDFSPAGGGFENHPSIHYIQVYNLQLKSVRKGFLYEYHKGIGGGCKTHHSND